MDAQRRLVGVDPLRFAVPTAGPERPQYIVAVRRNGETRQPIEPGPGADVVDMARRAVAGLEGLPIGEVPLLRLGCPIEPLPVVHRIHLHGT